MKLRLFRKKEKTGRWLDWVHEDGTHDGGYEWGLSEPVLQVWVPNSAARIALYKRRRNVDLPSGVWVDVPVVNEGEHDDDEL